MRQQIARRRPQPHRHRVFHVKRTLRPNRLFALKRAPALSRLAVVDQPLDVSAACRQTRRVLAAPIRKIETESHRQPGSEINQAAESHAILPRRLVHHHRRRRARLLRARHDRCQQAENNQAQQNRPHDPQLLFYRHPLLTRAPRIPFGISPDSFPILSAPQRRQLRVEIGVNGERRVDQGELGRRRARRAYRGARRYQNVSVEPAAARNRGAGP